ncbi:MAG: hypothetical protein QHH04_06915 [Methanolinea sp.]|nr:hypothetical protein [Methanolinea sp.]
MPATTIREPSTPPGRFRTHCRNQEADPENERIFGSFVSGVPAATARCTRHPGGMEMDSRIHPRRVQGAGRSTRPDGGM